LAAVDALVLFKSTAKRENGRGEVSYADEIIDLAAQLNSRVARLEAFLAKQPVLRVGIEAEVTSQVCEFDDERHVAIDDGVAAEEGACLELMDGLRRMEVGSIPLLMCLHCGDMSSVTRKSGGAA